MKAQNQKYTVCLFVVALLQLLADCVAGNSYYLVGDNSNKRVLGQLLGALDKTEKAPTGSFLNRFVIINEVSQRILKANYQQRQIDFLVQYVLSNPNDPYNAYYMYLASQTYRDMGASALSAHYLKRILANYADVKFMGKSVYFLCYEELLKNTENWDKKIEYYKQIIAKFEEYIDIGVYYYYLAQAYEKVGSWDLAMQTYKQFLGYPNVAVPSNPNAYREITERIVFYEVSKDWLVEDLNDLVLYLKKAIRDKDIGVINRHKSKVNFYAKYWSQQEYHDEVTEKVFNIGAFLLISDVRCSESLEADSNANEAYLKTWGWNYVVGTWYLYFKRVKFPEDPEIDGKWEWAGIYFGEKN